MSDNNALIVTNSVDVAVQQWLAARASNSPRTLKAYRDMMHDFREALHALDLDLDSNPTRVVQVAEQWASSSKRDKQVSNATYNLRLTTISSFYAYANRKAALSGRLIVNPIDAVDRKARRPYERAMPLDSKVVKKALKSIDRSTLQGKRDYALLLVLTTTGRRLSEVANMRRGDLNLSESRILVSFPHCKGNKAMSDHLTEKQSQALIDYLYTLHEGELSSLPNETPIWVSLSHANYGKPLGTQTIADVCKRYLGTSKVHALRHTFAVMMEATGATVSDIQKRLGHASLNETSIYLERLHAAENPFSEALDELLGTGD